MRPFHSSLHRAPLDARESSVVLNFKYKLYDKNSNINVKGKWREVEFKK
jgi:hypothetical protein